MRIMGPPAPWAAAPESCKARPGSSKPTPGPEAPPGSLLPTVTTALVEPAATGDAGSNGFERDGGAGANGSNLSRGASGTTDPGSIDPNAGSGGQDGYAVVIY